MVLKRFVWIFLIVESLLKCIMVKLATILSMFRLFVKDKMISKVFFLSYFYILTFASFFPPKAHSLKRQSNNPAVFRPSECTSIELPLDLRKNVSIPVKIQICLKTYDKSNNQKLAKYEERYEKIISKKLVKMDNLVKCFTPLSKKDEFLYKKIRAKTYHWKTMIEELYSDIICDLIKDIENYRENNIEKTILLKKLNFIKKVIFYIKNLRSYHLKSTFFAQKIIEQNNFIATQTYNIFIYVSMTKIISFIKFDVNSKEFFKNESFESIYQKILVLESRMYNVETSVRKYVKNIQNLNNILEATIKKKLKSN